MRAISADRCHSRPVRCTPPVEDPVDGAEHARPFVVEHEGRPEVAHPELVERRLDDLDGAAEHAAGAVDLGRIDDHRDGLEVGDRVRDGRPGGVALLALGGGVAQRQARARERHPGAIVRGCLCGHAPGHGVSFASGRLVRPPRDVLLIM